MQFFKNGLFFRKTLLTNLFNYSIRPVFASESHLVVNKSLYPFVQPPTTGGRGMQTPPSKTTGRQDFLFLKGTVSRDGFGF
jgi:hypothetical protein